MAKKVVASMQAAGKEIAKVYRMVPSPKTGAYTFKESIMSNDEAKALFGVKDTKK